MRNQLLMGAAFAALMIPGAAFAQSSGSTDFDNAEVVVTAVKADKGDVVIPDVPKSRVTIGADLISRARPGQTVNDIINLVPGVSFQNNDATGAAGGTFTIRGFDSTRISQTLDGIPLNDTGNYAIYSNQQQDPETLESVSVNLGTTDVDSPTASAVGGTVNIKTRVPSKDFGAMFSGGYGTYLGNGDPLNRSIYRIFGMIDSGDILHTGVRGFFSASSLGADNPFSNYSKLKKQQYNFRLYKSLGDNGDFISIAGQWNENRNNFLGSVPLRNDLVQSATNPLARVVGPNSNNRAPLTAAERFYSINYPCTVGGPTPGLDTAGAACGTEFDRRYNPSNTGNIRFGSRFTLTDKLVATVDASYQYVKANGGGTVTLLEGCGNQGSTTVRTCGAGSYTGVINTTGNTGNGSPGGFGYYTGRDLNGDGVINPATSVLGLAPSQTGTRRFGVVAGLAYDISDDHRVRVTYTFDQGRHRQTGEAGFVQANGEPFDVFPINNGITDSKGALIEKRDRKSFAILQQVSGEYRGKFFDQKLLAVLGVRAPFFKRDLTQNCFTVAANGNVSCISPTNAAAYAAANPYAYLAPGVNSTTNSVGATVTRPTTGSCAVPGSACVIGFAPPQNRVYNYNRVLPNVGLTWYFTPAVSAYASYAKGLSVPGTDNLYNAFYYPVGTSQSQPKPETTDSFDLGVRYTTSKVQAVLAGWYTKFQNRTASIYDVDTDTTVYRNLGSVDKWGIDASVQFKPIREVELYVFGSYLGSKIKDNIVAGQVATTTAGVTTYTTNFYQTAGKREGGSPEWMFGGRAQGSIGLFDLGVQGKYTGGRFVNDENLPVVTCSVATAGGLCPSTGTQSQIYPAQIPAYFIVDLDMRFNLGKLLGDNRKTYFQLNVGNLFDKVYIGGLSGTSGFVGLPNRFSVGNAVIGVPRNIMGTLVVGL